MQCSGSCPCRAMSTQSPQEDTLGINWPSSAGQAHEASLCWKQEGCFATQEAQDGILSLSPFSSHVMLRVKIWGTLYSETASTQQSLRPGNRLQRLWQETHSSSPEP